MKVVVSCIGCGKIQRRSECFHVKLLGKRNNASTIQTPEWIDVEDKVWLCKVCANTAGYKTKGITYTASSASTAYAKINSTT